MLDVMEREPHKKPDDDLARIEKEFAPVRDGLISRIIAKGEAAYRDQIISRDFKQYRAAYEEALGEHFEKFERETDEHRGLSESELGIRHDLFVAQLAELNENEALEHYAHPMSQEQKMRLETHFGTVRNQFLRDKDVAATSWEDHIRAREESGKGNTGGSGRSGGS